MKGLRYFSLAIALLFSCAGCASVSQRQNSAISKGIYAEHAAMTAGRFDEAEKYNDQLTRLVLPPKAPPVVHAFTTQGKTYAVLPQASQGVPTLVAGSPPFNAAVGQDKQLQANQGADGKALQKFSQAADAVVRAKDAEAAKYEAEKPSWFHSLLSWLFKLSLPLLLVGLVCLCVFFPPAIPFVIAGIRFALHIAKSFLKAIVSEIEEIEARLEGKGNPPSG